MEFASETPRVSDSFANVIEWLSVCRTRDLDRLMTFYDAKATLDCACTGQKLCNGKDELRTYWQKRLADPAPTTFTMSGRVATQPFSIISATMARWFVPSSNLPTMA